MGNEITPPIVIEDRLMGFDPYSDQSMKLRIRDFLRYRMVDPCDLITGDHAADLAFEVVKAVTAWTRTVDTIRLETELKTLRAYAGYTLPPFEPTKDEQQ